MFNVFLVISMLINVSFSDYASVEYIEHYYNYDEYSEFIFYFDCDYKNSHLISVEINFYDLNDTFIKGYKNEIKVIGEKKASAKIDYINLNSYVLINVIYKDVYLVKNARIDMYKTKDCYIDAENRICNEFYKSVFKDTSSLHSMNFKALSVPFDKFLYDNQLNMDDFLFYSEYDLNGKLGYLILKDKIDQYELPYFDGYHFLVKFVGDKSYHLELVDTYFLTIDNFKMSENYTDNSIEIDSIYFPFLDEYREYNFELNFEDIININMVFKVSCSDVLFGECDSSKYCLKRYKYV